MNTLVQEQNPKADTLTCDYNTYQRTRYFHGMLLSDRDFKEEQAYHAGKRHLINRMLHGWGVVCGLGIKSKRGLTITVDPGMALDCHGQEIVVCDPVDIDLKPCLSIPRGRATTPEECEARENEPTSKTVYIGICYRESATAPVPAYVPGGGCDEKECEHSRVKEGFCIRVFEHCPDPHPTVPDGLLKRLSDCDTTDGSADAKAKAQESREAMLDEFCRKPLPCPDYCPEEHYVGLGQVEINLKDRCVQTVRMNVCRSYVLSANLLKYLLVSIFAGAEEIPGVPTKQDSPDLNLMNLICNPIEALCWWLRYVETKGESATTPPPDNGTSDEIKRLKDEVQKLQEAVEELKAGGGA